MPDDELRNAVHGIVSRLQTEFEGHLARIEERHRAERDEVRRQAEIDAHNRVSEEWAAKLAAARTEWQSQLQAELADAAARAEAHLTAETDRLRAEAQQAAHESSGRARQEIEHAVHEATTRVREEMEQAAILSTARLRAELEEAAAQSTVHLRDQMEHALTAERERVTTAIEAERARLHAEWQSEADAKRATVAAEIETERLKARTLTAALDDARAALENEQRARQAAEEALAAEKQAHAADAQALAAERQAHAAEKQAHAALQQTQSEQASIDARADERQSQLALTEGLLAAVRAITEARSLTDTLSALAAAAAVRAPRAALFIVNDRGGERELQGWRASGFDPSPALLRLPADDGSLLATAVASRNALTTATVSAPAFASLPSSRAALAVPITVGGKSVAVLYADDGASGDVEAPASWPEALQILAAHASVCLSHITAVRTTQVMRSSATTAQRGQHAPSDEDNSARRYARLLVSEIKLYNEAAVRAGREKRDLLNRLRPEIERARRLYEERVSPSITARAAYFQEELVHTLADGDAALLGSA
ncbi:MAG TPA: GAF domain-containing protein [Vicinamibacterales bacterium]|nr:GAF domain-containing protein [Vicinamibacterales bacterium]